MRILYKKKKKKSELNSKVLNGFYSNNNGEWRQQSIIWVLYKP